MARIEINGIGIEYQVIGNGKRNAIITPGGRYPGDTPGVPELAQKLAEADFKVVIWDRPNCGKSDLCFDGPSESLLNADVLAGLLRALKMTPAMVIGGSAGSRVSLMAAIRHPDVASSLVGLWMTGGIIGPLFLVSHYYHDSWMSCHLDGGMENVASLPEWKPFVERSERNRKYLLDHEPLEFRDKLVKWAKSFIPQEGVPIPGVTPEQLGSLKIPVMVFRSGVYDAHHPRETSEALASMIPGSKLVEPPWGDREYLQTAMRHVRGEVGLFHRWPLLAPQIIDFARA
jgi:pimeloyl-ACP methyl ester carboxylesterase